MKAKSETARVAAIRELLDRGYGKATEFLAAEDEASASNMTAAELWSELLAELAELLPEFRLVPVEQPNLVAGVNDRLIGAVPTSRRIAGQRCPVIGAV